MIKDYFTSFEEFDYFRPIRQGMSKKQRDYILTGNKTDVHQRTLESLQRKNLIRDNGSLTDLGERVKLFLIEYQNEDNQHYQRIAKSVIAYYNNSLPNTNDKIQKK